MKKIRGIFATLMATMCSASYFNFANAWGHVGITDKQIRQLQSEFYKVWKTLKPGDGENLYLPEDKIIDAARNEEIDLDCVVKAKIFKDILVSWDILGTTLSSDTYFSYCS